MTASWSNLSLVAGAAGGCVYSFYYVALAARAARWPAVDGEIAQTRLVRRTVDDQSTDFEYVAYRYSVDGQPYRNDRVTFGPVVAFDLGRSPVPSAIFSGHRYDDEGHTDRGRCALLRSWCRSDRQPVRPSRVTDKPARRRPPS